MDDILELVKNCYLGKGKLLSGYQRYQYEKLQATE
jgi:hypothetical protein